ncbi:hypothetical protein HOT99_gp162 [Caulobacter phage CcrBL10]|uniref:Uncharacterized protein n=1 Tax=Caulobacter phage CcrBL10 TaxID=2283269 RepID=A0A385EBT8_9CAUD|nr:hypothetical protein HOT99_gp162 [Caulobacter phage CcrBL10]AXQ68455.1 hypothetical protein CcrBL10_gp251 [Caulobacter phage CcrBL10]
MSEVLIETRADAIQAVALALYQRQWSRGGQVDPPAWATIPPQFKKPFLETAELCVDLIIEHVRNNSHEPS